MSDIISPKMPNSDRNNMTTATAADIMHHDMNVMICSYKLQTQLLYMVTLENKNQEMRILERNVTHIVLSVYLRLSTDSH